MTGLSAHAAGRARMLFPRSVLAVVGGSLAGVGAVIGAVLYVLPRIEDTTYTFDAPHVKAQLRIVL